MSDDSTPHRCVVNRPMSARRCRSRAHGAARRAALAQQIVRDVERRHHGDALGARDLAGVADLAHPAIEERDGVEELGALGLLAGNLVIAAEQRDVERHRALARWRGFAVIRRARRCARASASRRRVASATRSPERVVARSAAARSRRSASLAARSARVCAISVASLLLERQRGRPRGGIGSPSRGTAESVNS